MISGFSRTPPSGRSLKERLLFLPMLAAALFVTMPCARGQNITDTGPGSFADIDNTGTQDYVLVNGGASIGNVTNAGILDANNLSTAITTACCGSTTFNIGIDGSTVTGNVINNGVISQTNANNNFVGILLSNASSVGGSVMNNGSIFAMPTTMGNEASGILIDDSSIVTGDVTNSGTITATAGVNGSATGIDNEGTITGNLTNSGTITATVGAGDGGEALGIDNFGTITGNLTNSGTITATVGAGADGTAVGIRNFNASSLTNTGTITATVGAGDGGEALGIDNFGTITCNLTNSGTITATVGAGDGGEALGIDNFGTITSNLTNSGTITATVGAGADGTAVGIRNFNASSLTNTGTITATVGAGDGGEALGIDNFGTITGNLTNSGTITATVGAGVNGFATGIGNFGTITGNLTNTGTITALASTGGTAWAILNEGQALTINQNAGAINGNVGLSGADTFNINGGTVTGSVIGNQESVGIGDAVNVNGGMLAVPAGGSISEIGSYAQGASGTLSLGVTPTTSANVSASTIAFDGTLKVAPSGGGWSLNTPANYIDFVAANTSLSGGFSSVTAPALFTASVTPDTGNANSLDLSVTEVSAGSTPAINNFIAGLLGNSNNTPAAQNLANVLESLTAPQLQSAITQLKGSAVAQSIQALRDVPSGFSDMVQQRILTGDAYDTSDILSINMVGQNVQLASSANTPLLALAPAPEGGTWMRGFGSFASGAGQGGVAGFTEDRGGVIVGLDKKLNDHWLLGLAAQYAYTSLGFADGSASSSADSYNGMVYGGWHQNRLYVDGTAGFGWNSYTSSRSLDIGGFTANSSGNFSGQDASASVETGYAFPVKDWRLTPYAGFDYTYTQTDAFTESGDGVSNLMVQASDSNSLITSLGIRAATKIETENNGTFQPELHLAWEHENLDNDQSLNAAFVISPGNVFSVTSPQYGRDSAVIGAAITQQFSQHLRVFLSWDARLSEGYTENALSGGFRLEF